MTTVILVYTIVINAIIAGIDPSVALAVASVESNFNVNAVGLMNEQGVFQIMPQYSKYSIKELKDPAINIKEGMRMLKYAKDNCVHQKDNTFVLCYNLGWSGAKKIKHPQLFPYYKKVMAAREKLKQQKVAVK